MNQHFASKIGEARSKILLHFILCSLATQCNLLSLCDALGAIKQQNPSIEDQFWSLLPLTTARESLIVYSLKLEHILSELHNSDFPDKIIKQAQRLSPLNDHSILELLEDALDQGSAQLVKQRLEMFKVNNYLQRGGNTISQY